MSRHMTQEEIRQKTGYVRQSMQEAALRSMGYIVLKRNGRNQVQALANHPSDPALPANATRDEVVLNL